MSQFTCSHRCELFRTGAKVPFCLDFAMIYAFVPRAANTKLAFRVDLPTIFRARTARDIYETSMSRRPCNDLRVRAASSTIRSGTERIYLRRPPRNRIGTKSFESALIVWFPAGNVPRVLFTDRGNGFFKLRDRHNHAWVETGAACS